MPGRERALREERDRAARERRAPAFEDGHATDGEATDRRIAPIRCEPRGGAPSQSGSGHGAWPRGISRSKRSCLDPLRPARGAHAAGPALGRARPARVESPARRRRGQPSESHARLAGA